MAHILVVDDELPIRILVRIVLQSVGHHVFEAGNGQEALSLLKTYKGLFNMVLLDLHMPHMDGVQFLSENHHQTVLPPIIVLSAHLPVLMSNSSDPIKKSLEQTIFGYLSKPFSSRELIRMTDTCLRANTPVQPHETIPMGMLDLVYGV